MIRKTAASVSDVAGRDNSLGAKDRRHFFKAAFRGAPGTFELSEAELLSLQGLLKDMLQDLLDVFEREKIFYTLSGGSVLGTIRHGCFIPWDDDIDLNMPRKDFEHLKAVFDRTLGDKYELCAPETCPEHGMTHVQLRKRGTVYRGFNELGKSSAGVPVDIFVLENVSDNALIRRLHGMLCLAAGYVLTCRKTHEDWTLLYPYIRGNSGLLSAYRKKRALGRIFGFIPLEKMARFAIHIYTMCRNEHSERVSIPSGRKHFFGEMYRRSDMCESRWGEFEGLKVRLPYGTETYLRILYGDDYMTPPPAEERETHSVMEFKM